MTSLLASKGRALTAAEVFQGMIFSRAFGGSRAMLIWCALSALLPQSAESCQICTAREAVSPVTALHGWACFVLGGDWLNPRETSEHSPL